MTYADVAVNVPFAPRHSFCYYVPPQLNVQLGQAVWVPFGSRTVQGVIVGLTDYPSVEVTKPISDLITSSPLLSPTQVELAVWMSNYYLSPLFDAVALMLPPGFERRLITFLQLNLQPSKLGELDAELSKMVDFLASRGKVSIKELERRFGKRRTGVMVEQLVRRRLVSRSEELQQVRVGPKVERFLKLTISSPAVEEELVRLRNARAYKQAEVLEFLLKQGRPVRVAEVRRGTACSSSVIECLQKRKLVAIELVEVKRQPLAGLHIHYSTPPDLTPSQLKAWQRILSQMNQKSNSDSPLVFLLHGVTGSGKTEIYLRTLAEVVSRGKRGICLVPEIALTPQMIERFLSRFPGRVAVLHSGLSLGEQFDEWQRIRDGSCDVVIGPRSALFSPQPDLGLIVIDEEHEWTYKQTDKSPRYHCRDVAIKLAQLTGAAVMLGSATPDVETYYRSLRGEYELIELKERITLQGIAPLPEVEVIDLREELRADNRSLFSRRLLGAISETLNDKGQVILFLNRRGTATFIQCWRCGFVFQCRSCTVALAHHAATRKLVCHHCGYSVSVPDVCPSCSSSRLKFLGVGTQKVEEEVRSLFPHARVVRWDSDVTTKRKAHEQLLSKLRNQEADILVGTQMVAKGLDLPGVALVGVVNADTGLNFPDFRAGERTFQLLCQVAGRAGRGFTPGRVIIQTYCPEHYAIKAASKHNYTEFYIQELSYRRQFGYPPFGHLARLIFNHTNEAKCLNEAQRVARLLMGEIRRRGLADVRLIGPAPSFIPRVRGHYQWQILLCGDRISEFLASIALPRGWIVDIDPVGVV